jgi:hypothetical protein
MRKYLHLRPCNENSVAQFQVNPAWTRCYPPGMSRDSVSAVRYPGRSWIAL